MDVAVMDRLEDILSSCEYNGGGINTLLENALLNAGSVVKSVQRGYSALTGLPSSTKKVTTTINNVNPDKCLVTIDTSGSENARMTNFELTNNTLIIHFDHDPSRYGLYCSWQITEFY